MNGRRARTCHGTWSRFVQGDIMISAAQRSGMARGKGEPDRRAGRGSEHDGLLPAEARQQRREEIGLGLRAFEVAHRRSEKAGADGAMIS